MTRCLPAEDFTVSVERRTGRRGADEPATLVTTGRLTAAGGELLYCAIVTMCGQAEHRLVADLTAVSELSPEGWAWLLSAWRECQAAGCELQLLLPGAKGRPAEPAADAGRAAEMLRAEPTRLRCYPDGPILVRGDFELVDRAGRCLPRTRSVVALCRCGGSAIKPFCDGTHKTLDFTDR